MCIAVLNDVLTRISIKFRSQPPGGTISPDFQSIVTNGNADQHNGIAVAKKCESCGPTDKQCSLTPLANMSSARCALGIGVLDGQLVALGKPSSYSLVGHVYIVISC